MSLPSGYTRLEYIQSNGAQYINAGLSGSSKTRVVCTISNWPKTAKSTSIFGCRSASGGSDLFLILCAEDKGTYRSDFYNTKTAITDAVSIEDTPVTIDKNKNVTTFSNMSTSFTGTSGTFTSLYDLYIFACNTKGTAGMFTNGVKLYSMQIYTDDTLMRDYIPCKNANGVVGLWDDVWSVFYPNSGSGNLTAGPAVRGSHQALVNGTAYNILGGRTLIGGTGYGISKGRTLVGGTGYDIAFGAAEKALSSITPGNIVKLNESGSPVEFYVATHNYEKALNGNRTLLVRKNCTALAAWNSSANNAYANSTIITQLNGTYKNKLDSGIRSAIGTTYFYYTADGYTSGTSGLSRSVFLLSATELGGTDATLNTEGSRLPIYSMLQVAYRNGNAVPQWTRSPVVGSGSNVYRFWSTGVLGNAAATSQFGIRPCFTLPGTTLVDADNNVIV